MMKMDPVARMDAIVEQLSALYAEADTILEAYVNAICADAPAIPRDIMRHHVETLARTRKKKMP